MLVIDGSFSMGYRPGDKTRFERAKEIASRIVEESRQGDGFTLVLMSEPPRVVDRLDPQRSRGAGERHLGGGGTLPGRVVRPSVDHRRGAHVGGHEGGLGEELPEELGQPREHVHVLVADGGISTQLQLRGFPAQEMAETANLNAPDIVLDLARAYLQAGAQFLTQRQGGFSAVNF